MFAVVFFAGVVQACNPFAPALDDGDPFLDLFGDPRTIDGFFTNFQSAYELRDMSLYQTLLDSSFTFSYRDYELQIDRQWGFIQELETTRRLFNNASLIRLQWNHIIASDIDDPQRSARVVRSFNLTVALEAGDVFRGDGNVNFHLARPDTTAPWRLTRWRDESEF